MSSVVTFPVYNRPHYLRQVLESWSRVRGIDRWDFQFGVEPTSVQGIQLAMIRDYFPDAVVIENQYRLGLVENLYQVLRCAFETADFVVLAEDDLPVSTDVIEYFEWARDAFVHDSHVAMAGACGEGVGTDPSSVILADMSPHVWGTWRSRWEDYIGPLWEGHGQTSNNGVAQDQVGWDWNLQRIVQSRGLQVLRPVLSRSDDVGVEGIHSTAALHAITRPKNFVAERPPVEYRVVSNR